MCVEEVAWEEIRDAGRDESGRVNSDVAELETCGSVVAENK